MQAYEEKGAEQTLRSLALTVWELQLHLEEMNGHLAAAEVNSILREWQESEAMQHATWKMSSQEQKGKGHTRQVCPLAQATGRIFLPVETALLAENLSFKMTFGYMNHF